MFEGADWSSIDAGELRLHFIGDRETISPLYSSLTTSCVGLELLDEHDRPRSSLGPRAVRPFGFAPEESLLPARAVPPTVRLLEELFWLPEKFMGVSISGAGAHGDKTPFGKRIALAFELEDVPEELGPIGVEHIAVSATPAVGLRTVRQQTAARNGRSQLHVELPSDCVAHSVQSVRFFDRGAGEWVEIPAALEQRASKCGLWFSVDPLRSDQRQLVLAFKDAEGRLAAPAADTMTVRYWILEAALRGSVGPGAVCERALGVPSSLLPANPVEARHSVGLIRSAEKMRRLIRLEQASLEWLCSREGILSLVDLACDDAAGEIIRSVEVRAREQLEGRMMCRVLELELGIEVGRSTSLAEALILARAIGHSLSARGSVRSHGGVRVRCRAAGRAFNV